MSDDEILSLLTEIFRDVFSDDTIVLEPDMTADDVVGWDSMSQVTLATELGFRLRIKFKSAEVGELRSVRQLIDLIRSRLRVAQPNASVGF